VISYLSHAPLLCYAFFCRTGGHLCRTGGHQRSRIRPSLQDTSFAPGYVLGRYGIASIYQHESWNTPMDKAHTTYSDPDSTQNQQFRDRSQERRVGQDGRLRCYSSSNDPEATWNYDTINDQWSLICNGSPQI